MDELIDLSEISSDHLLHLYCQLKLLDETGKLTNCETLGRSFDILESGVKLEPLTIDNDFVELLMSYNSEPSLLLKNMVDKLGLSGNLKNLLEKFLDVVFLRKTSDINFGRLLREFSLKLEDIEKVKDFLMNSANATIKSLFNKFIFVPSELEILLAVLFSNIDAETLRLQYETFADSTPRFQLTDEDVDVLLKHFDEAKQFFDDEMKKEHIDIEKELDKTLTKCDDVDVSVCEIDADLKKMSADIDALIKCDLETIKTMCLKERRSIDDNTAPEGYITPKKFWKIDLNSSTERSSIENFSADDSFIEIEHLAQVCQQPVLNRVMPSSMPQLRVNDPCFATENGLPIWVEAIVTKVGLNEVVVKLKDNHITTVHKSSVAFYAYPTWVLAVGDRVVGLFKSSNENCAWLGGIVGEQPSEVRNNNRYLIFFDNGDAQYVDYTHIRRIYGPSNPGYLDIRDPTVRVFVMEYVKKYPERAVVRLKKDQTVKVQFNGCWQKTKVIELDGMMVKLYFEDGHYEWLYRGNKRLEPIFTQEMNVQQNIQSGRRYRRSNRPSAAPVVEFVSDDEGADDENYDGRTVSTAQSQSSGSVQVAKKSTGPKQQRSIKLGDSATIYSQEEDDSDIVEEQLSCPDLTDYFKRRVYSRHVCSPMCLTVVDNPLQFRGQNLQNPLSIPLRCGWERIISLTHANGENARTRKIVVYSAPCCQRLRTINEVSNYLRRTDSKLTVDLFCFDPAVRPLARFRMKKMLFYDRDFTKGKESVPIECVNCLTNEAPQKLNYEPRRYTTDRSVDLPLAYEFLSGCDCEDNCTNKAKCSCQQLTIQQTTGILLNDKPDVRAGYDHRLLPRGVVYTGIFECNPRCKCSSRCCNRVVQNPLISVLQLFKTRSRGWGVRTLYDIPKGAFIAIYAGNVLSDTMANELGRTQGDEYFAELDLIQLSEKLKEGYEAEVIPPDDDEIINSSDNEFEINENSQDSARSQASAIGRTSSMNSESDDDVILISDEPSAQAPPLSVSQPITLKRWSIAKYIGEDKVYTLDAKVSGNIGRYLNHSCSPNVFVQNVYVDTHDLSLPWVAFFAAQRIKAGSELCWDYAYTVGSVPGKEIKCHCGSTNCRRRLL